MIDNDDDIQRDILFFYNTFEKIKVNVQIDVKTKNFEVFIKRSHSDRRTNEIRRVDLICNREIIYKTRNNDKSRTKNINTIKCECFWKIKIIKFKFDKFFKWQLIVMKNSKHNHESTNKFFVLREHRHRELNTLLKKVDQLKTLISTKIVDKFKINNSNNIIQFKNIYNAKTKFRKKRFDKYIFTQLLLKILHEKNWFVKFLLKIENKRVNKYHRINHWKLWFWNKSKKKFSLIHT